MAEEVKVPELEKAEIPWVVAYLREDIQDLRNEVRENRRSIQRLRRGTSGDGSAVPLGVGHDGGRGRAHSGRLEAPALM